MRFKASIDRQSTYCVFLFGNTGHGALNLADNVQNLTGQLGDANLVRVGDHDNFVHL